MIPPSLNIKLHSENGILGVTHLLPNQCEDSDLIDAGKTPVGLT